MKHHNYNEKYGEAVYEKLDPSNLVNLPKNKDVYKSLSYGNQFPNAVPHRGKVSDGAITGNDKIPEKINQRINDALEKSDGSRYNPNILSEKALGAQKIRQELRDIANDFLSGERFWE